MNRPELLKGALAGFVGGLVASWAMGQAHALTVTLLGATARQGPGEDSTVKTARALTRPVLRRELTGAEAKAAGPVVHYAFGSSVAAVYGAAAEAAPGVTRAAGLPFGAAVWLGAHAIAVPALGLSPPVTRSTGSAELAEFAAHLVYGGLTECVRRGLRRWAIR